MYTDEKAEFTRMLGMSGGCGCEGGRADLNSNMTAKDHAPCAQQRTWGLAGYPVGMVYAPIQAFDHIYDPGTALTRGTIFGALDLPFVCGDKKKGGCSCD